VKKTRILGLVLIAGLLLALLFTGGCYLTGTETTTPAAGEAGGISSILPLIIFLVLIFAMMYFLMVRPQRKRQKEQQQLLSELKRGDKIITSSGIYGVIESLSEDSAVIKVESGATMRIARTSIAGKREG
jgi:preprotein translocase subunit YajC